jgi:hypothetical protein
MRRKEQKMRNCILANTGACKRAIGLAHGLCAVDRDLIPAVQSGQSRGTTDATAGLANTAAGHTDAADSDFVNHGVPRIGPLCNERTFTIGHDHVDNIGTHQFMDSRTKPTKWEVSP